MMTDSKVIVICALFLITSLKSVNGDTTRGQPAKTETQIVRQLLNESNYDKSVRSTDDIGRTNIDITMYVLHVDKLDYMTQMIKKQIYFRAFWNDTRLTFDPQEAGKDRIHIPPSLIEKIWRPDVFFPNSIDTTIHRTIYPDTFARIAANGEVLISSRFDLKLMCPMDLSTFPFDKPVCTFKISSYGYTAAEVFFRWKEGKTSSVGISYEVSTFRYRLLGHKTFDCTTKTRTGYYSCLGVEFFFKANPGSFYRILFFPAIAIVSISWFVFWIDAIAHRLVLLLTCFSMEFLLLYKTYSLRPPVSYFTALDWWNGICFSTLLLELFVVLQLNSKGEESRASQKKPNEDEATRGWMSSLVPSSVSSLFGRCSPSVVLPRVLFPFIYYIAVIAYFNAYKDSGKIDESMIPLHS